ncbi:MAG: hypothetical protein HEEMFOPI_00923 [Holosporales bacterium]
MVSGFLKFLKKNVFIFLIFFVVLFSYKVIKKQAFYKIFMIEQFYDLKSFDDDHVVTKLDNGMPIVVNKHDQCVCFSVREKGLWDKNETNVIKKIIKKDFKIIEVGANFGVHTLRIAELVGKQGKIYAFEANSTVSKYLKESIKMNSLDNVVLYEKAAGDESGESYLTFDIKNIGGGYLTPHGNSAAVRTQIVRLDDVIKESHIDVLKIDAEGYEYKIFKGAKNIIDKNVNHIILMIEWVQRHLKNQNTDPKDVIDFFKSYNFKLWKIGSKKGEPLLVPISYDELLKLEVGDVLASKLELNANESGKTR